MKTSQTFFRRRLLGSVFCGLALAVMASSCDSCKKDTPPPPLPSATEAPSAPDVAVLPVEEDAGEDAADADADAKKVVVGPPPSSLKKCCAALQQNAANAPPPTNIYMTQAAAACYAAVNQGKDKGSVIAIVQGALKGAGMPGACR